MYISKSSLIKSKYIDCFSGSDIESLCLTSFINFVLVAIFGAFMPNILSFFLISL